MTNRTVKVKFINDHIIWQYNRFIKFLSDEVYTVEDHQTHWKYGNVKILSHKAVIVKYDKPIYPPILNSNIKPISLTFGELRNKIRRVRESYKDNIDMIKIEKAFQSFQRCIRLTENPTEIITLSPIIHLLDEYPFGLLFIFSPNRGLIAIKDVTVIKEDYYLRLDFIT